MSVYAQDGVPELTETFITADGAFQFDYPAGWALEERSDGAVELTGTGAIITIYPPFWIQATSLMMPDFVDAIGLLESYTAAMREAGMMELEPFEKIRLDTGVAARSNFVLTAENLPSSPVQFFLAAPAGDGYALVYVLGDDEALSRTIYAIAESFVVFEDAVPRHDLDDILSAAANMFQLKEPLALTETYVTQDGAFQFDYPAGWVVEERPDFAVELVSSDVRLTIFTPNYLATSGLFEPDTRTVVSFMESFAEAVTPANIMAFEPVNEVALTGGLTAARSDYVFLEEPNAGSLDASEFALAVPVDDQFALMLVLGPNDDGFVETVYAMAASFVVLNDTVPEPRSGSAQSDALGLPVSARDNVRVLEEAGLIEGDGEFIWLSAYMSTTVGGPVLISERSLSDFPNIAGGAFLSFHPESEDGICGLIARFRSEPEAEQILIMALTAQDDLSVLDASPETQSESNIEFFENNISFLNPQQLVYVLRDNRLTLLINGEIVVKDHPVSLPEPDSTGDVPGGMVGAVMEADCVLTDAWAYGFEGQRNEP